MLLHDHQHTMCLCYIVCMLTQSSLSCLPPFLHHIMPELLPHGTHVRVTVVVQCVCVCVCWVMYLRMRGKMVKRGENRLWEAFCPLHVHTITQAAVRARPRVVIPQPTPISIFLTYKYIYVYHQRYLYIHCCTSNYIKREPQSNPLWSSGEFLIPQT